MLLGLSTLQAQEQSEPITEGPNTSIYLRKPVLEQRFRQVYYGARVGVALSSLGTDAENTSNKVGILFGGFVGMNLHAQLSLQGGLQYLRKGAKIDSGTPNIGVTEPVGLTLNARYEYLAIPLTVRYFPWEELGVFVEGGIQPSLLLKAELVGLGDDFDADGVEGEISVKDELNSIDLAPRIGIGYEWREALEFSVSYQYGLANTLANSDLSVNNQFWQISLGYRLE